MEGPLMSWDPDLGDEPAPAWRDQAPDILSPIDEGAPVSGHHPPISEGIRWAEAPEHDWTAAASRIMPVLRPAGASGTALAKLDQESIAREALKTHASPLIDAGPVDLSIAYAMRAQSFDVLVNADHLLAWSIEPTVLRATALENLRLWSATAPWDDELSGDRRLLSSETGEGGDAARILLPEVRQHLADELGAAGRVLIGLPDRHLLVAGTLRPDDADFAALFATFVAERSEDADEPIDRRLFELVGGELRLFAA
jgi:hypothetical protein